jgi:predicted enzyme related to lactoylglutathione lyase
MAQRIVGILKNIQPEAASRVEKAGGKIIQPKYLIGDMGWIVLIEDSEGNEIGLHSTS